MSMKRFGLIGLVALSALALSACDDSGDDGGAGGERNAGGSGAGANGDDESCTVEDNGDGTATISCPDGTEVDVSTTPASEIEQCSVEDNGDGTATITCPDGSSVTTAVGGIGADPVRFIQFYNDIQLYSVQGSGVHVTRVNRQRVSTTSITAYTVSADNTKVLYYADHDTDGTMELYLVDISDGSPSEAVKLNGTLTVGGNVSSAVFSPDGNWVAYLADQAVDEVYEAYVVDISGDEPAAAVKVNGALLPTGDVASFQFSPDSSMLAVLQDRSTEAVNELYLVDLSSPDAGTRVNPALLTTRSVENDYAFSADSNDLYYRADQLTSNVIELFVSDVSSGAPETAVEVSAISAGAVGSYFVSPNGDSVVYQDGNDAHLYLVGRGAPGTATLLYSTANTPAVTVPGATFSRDSSLFLLLGSNVVDDTGVLRLVGVEVDGGTPGDALDLSGEIVTGGAVASFSLSPSGERLAFYGDVRVDGMSDLSVVNLTEPANAPVLVAEPISGYGMSAVYNWAETADVLHFRPNAPTGYAGSAVVDLSGASPAEARFFMDDTSYPIQYNYGGYLSETGEHLLVSTILEMPLYNVATGISVDAGSVYYALPIEFVNPLD